MKTNTAILIAAILISGAIFMFRGGVNNDGNEDPILPAGNNVTAADGKQTVEIFAKGGYSPRESVAKAETSVPLKKLQAWT